MSQQFDFENQDFFTSSNSTNLKKNFFDFEDDDNVICPVLPESDHNTTKPSNIGNKLEDKSSSYSSSGVTPISPTPISTTPNHLLGKTSFSSAGASIITTKSSSNKSSLLDFRFIDPERKIAELISTFQYENPVSTKLVGSPTSSSILSPRLAIERIIDGDSNVNLSVFRGKEQKLELLDYALITGDTYVIKKILLFLYETLKSSIFYYEITRRPVAADHFLLYLHNTEQFDKLLDALVMMGRNEEAAFAIYFRAIHSSQSGESQIKLLNKALLNFNSGDPEIGQWQVYIKDQISLLEQQFPIEADDRRRESEEKRRIRDGISNELQSGTSNDVQDSSNLFVIFPRPKLVGRSVMETLNYCCLYHYHLSDTNFASPVYIKKRYSLSEKQFLHTSLQALAKGGMWPEIDSLFEYKSWLGSRKIKNSIPIEEIVYVLYRNSSPPEMLEKYLELVDDIERRIQISKDLRMSKFTADILIKLKDRKRLSELRSSINTSKEVDYIQRYIDNALKSSTIKWRN